MAKSVYFYSIRQLITRNALTTGLGSIILAFIIGVVSSWQLEVYRKNNFEAHEQLRQSRDQSQEKYEQLVEKLPEMVFEIDIKGNLLFANKRGFEITGYSKEDFSKGFDVFNLVAPQDKEKVFDDFQKTLNNQPTPYNEYTVVRKDGSTFPAIITATSIIENGRPIGIRGIVIDITESKKIQEALLQSEIKFRTVANFTYDWEHWMSPDGMLIYVSPSCERISGYKPEEFIKDSDLIVKIVHPDDKALIESHYKSINSKTLPDVDYRIITKSGEVRWIAHVCQPVFDDKGTWLGRRGSNRDITERKKARMALEESEERYRQLFSSMTEMFFVAELLYDDNGKVVDFIYCDSNPAFLKSIGKIRDQVVGKRTSELLGTIESYWLEEFNKIERTGQAVHAEIKSGVSGRFYDVHAWKAGGNQVGVIFEDITQRKVLEKKLQDNERMAAIGQTAGMVGHDIRNPLQAVLSDTYLLKDELASMPECLNKEGVAESIDSIERNIAYINKIVQDLQDYY